MQPQLDRTFEDKKAEGDYVEELISTIFRYSGFHVSRPQEDRDLADDGGGKAAAIYGPINPLTGLGFIIPQPDLVLIRPQDGLKIAVEVRSKEPRWIDNTFGWEEKNLKKNENWQRLWGIPVYYAVRDKTVCPVPIREHPNQMDCVCPYKIASVTSLRIRLPDTATEVVRTRNGERVFYWPQSVFTPLADFLTVLRNPDNRLIPVLLKPQSISDVQEII